MEKNQSKSHVKVLPQAQQPGSKRSYITKLLTSFVIVGALAAGGGYYVGFQKGKAEGGEAAIKKIGDALNPLNLLANNPVLPNTVMGQIASVGNDSITITQINGQKKQIEINHSTQITQHTNTLNISDLKPGNQVTVFVNKQGKLETASRIIVR